MAVIHKDVAGQIVVARRGSPLIIGVGEEGMYKVTREDLTSLGLDAGSIDPRTLRIYGHGSGMLPQEAGAYPYDDLLESPVWVSGEADGNFDNGDYLLFYAASPHAWAYSNTYDRWTHRS